MIKSVWCSSICKKNSLQVVECDNLNSKLCKSIWCKIYVESVSHFVVSVYYRSELAEESEICEMFECIRFVCETSRSVLIIGDFNYSNMQGLQYNERQLGLVRLERRRVRSDLIETFKIMNGEYDLSRDLFFQLEGVEEIVQEKIQT